MKRTDMTEEKDFGWIFNFLGRSDTEPKNDKT